jgi:hypothetical protein
MRQFNDLLLMHSEPGSGICFRTALTSTLPLIYHGSETAVKCLIFIDGGFLAEHVDRYCASVQCAVL